MAGKTKTGKAKTADVKNSVKKEDWQGILDRLGMQRETAHKSICLWSMDLGDDAQLVLYVKRETTGEWRYVLEDCRQADNRVVSRLFLARGHETLTRALHHAYVELMTIADSAMDIMDVLKKDAGTPE